MSMIKIRKNAFLKIQTILAGSVGVICRSSSSRIDDGYDDEYRVSSCDEALTWLKENQRKTAENPRPMRAGRKGGKARRALKILLRC